MNVNNVVRAAGDVAAYVVAGLVSRGLDLLAPLPNRQPISLNAVDESIGPVGEGEGGLPGFYGVLGDQPRVIHGRGLGLDERNAEWVDKDKDRWRWNRKLGSWQNKMSKPDICTTWYAVPTEDGCTSEAYAPYTETCIVTHISGGGGTGGSGVLLRPESPSAVVVAAPASGPPAEVKVPGDAPRSPVAGHPPRVNEDAAPVLREAAKALRGWTTGQRMVEELLPYWRNVAHCLDIYADECEWNAHPVKNAK